MGYDDYRYGWRPYVSVGERKRKADREIARLRKAGVEVQPVTIEGNAIAKTFWGKAWCRHLESFSDYENRLPRGRTYVRNGSVCHLAIAKGLVTAKVQGTAMYTVTVAIKPLSRKLWKGVKERCAGKIDSLLDLLGGKLSAGVMKVVTDRDTGLFPAPREIEMTCSCPDWATMCKHVAAVLYGVGARLDEKPELLFVLRGVNHDELIGQAGTEAVEEVVKGGTGRHIAEDQLSEIFGVELDEGNVRKAKPRRRPTAEKAAAQSGTNAGKAKKRPKGRPKSRKRKKRRS